MIGIPINPTSTTPMYEQIYDYIKSEILNGTLKAGEKLPSTRSLASYLLVSRNTIDMAYSQLLSEGYIDAKQKRGYYINEIVELQSIPVNQEEMITTHDNDDHSCYNYDFSPFTVDTSHFPFTTWKKLTTACLSNSDNFFTTSANQGTEAFRTAIASYLYHSRGVHASPEQIVIGAGADYLLQLVCSLFSSADCIAMEDPGYLQAKHIFTSRNLPTISIPVDEYGISFTSLSSSNANIAYVTPSHQYPLGSIMPINRRISLLSWAKEHDNRFIIEDDHDSEFRYIGKPIPSLQSIDRNEKVIYMGTFSKAISPALRIAYMVLPLPLLERFRQNLSFLSSTVSNLDQNIMTSFIKDGYFERHLNRMRKHYKAKHDCMIAAFRKFHEKITIQGSNAGLHLVVSFHTPYTETELVQLAKQNGIKLYPLSCHYETLPKDYCPTFMFGYANLSEQEITDGIETLYAML